MVVDGIHVCAVVNQELNDVNRESIGDRGVHQRRPAEHVVAVCVSSVIEQDADVAQVGKNSSVIERGRQDVLFGDLLDDAIDATGTVGGDGHGDTCFTRGLASAP